ncbi:hypothetical protein [Aquamicrobium ahrensii]|uniref:Uncharacterized protein n=1 Tax=Aquamicrobium ahrensii TaxID=469551 RepID=A0ABV2KN52_9HYPH
MTFRLILVGAVILAVIALVYVIREDGARSVTTKIERQNDAARNSADGARSAYDKCIDAGGMWNFSAGKCEGP